jgi:hypothetical protein
MDVFIGSHGEVCDDGLAAAHVPSPVVCTCKHDVHDIVPSIRSLAVERQFKSVALISGLVTLVRLTTMKVCLLTICCSAALFAALLRQMLNPACIFRRLVRRSPSLEAPSSCGAASFFTLCSLPCWHTARLHRTAIILAFCPRAS